MTSSLTPDPRRDFARTNRKGRTLTPRGVAALIVMAALAAALAQAFGGASSF